MCGIFCIISIKEKSNSSVLYEKFKLFEKYIINRGPNFVGNEVLKLDVCNVLLVASVLWLQGKDITKQPLNNQSSAFIYNGDVFGGIITEDTRNAEGDTKPLFKIFNSYELHQFLNNIQGPYAFIFLNKVQKKLYFGRDIYGRRSLLLGKNNDDIIITSVAKKNTKYDFIELPSMGTFCVELETQNWHIFPWGIKNTNFKCKLQDVELFLKNKITVHDCISEKQPLKFTFPSELELQLITKIESLENDKVFDFLCSNTGWLGKIKKLNELLENSLKKRLSAQPLFCQNCFKRYDCDHSLIGILFSGGVDCAILTMLAEKIIDKKYPIDLINVAFESSSDYQTPDRITGHATLKELQHLCPERIWNFIEVNVTKHELDMYRTSYISDLIYPLNSVLDDSLGCALWFASRAKTDSYTSPCRVLLVGMGADELFGGYTRHRAALQKRSWEGLHEVLEEDWQNLSHRNLARDDRVVSDHGRQLRTPYLDEEVVDFVRSLNCWEKSIPSNNLAKGLGDKILLRCLAHFLGLKNAAKFTKRALQFGSRIANPKEKAHEVSVRL